MRCSSATRSTTGQRRRAVVGDRGERGDRLFLVGLVGEAPHPVATLGVVADDAEEDDDRARGLGVVAHAVAASTGRASAVDGDPVAGCGREHGAMVVNTGPGPSGDHHLTWGPRRDGVRDGRREAGEGRRYTPRGVGFGG